MFQSRARETMTEVLDAVLRQKAVALKTALEYLGDSKDVLRIFGVFLKLAEDHELANSEIMKILKDFVWCHHQETNGVTLDTSVTSLGLENSTADPCSSAPDTCHSLQNPDSSQNVAMPESNLSTEMTEPEIDITKCLQYLSSGQTADALTTLLEAGLPTDFRDREGKTLLHHAAAENAVPHIKVLLTHHADVDAEDLQRVRPLMMACRNNSEEAFFLLLSRTGDINHADLCHQTALHCTCKADSVTCATALINKGIRLCTNVHQETELMVALAHNCQNIVPLLMDYGVNINARTRQSITALHYAAKYDCPKAAEFLCKANINSAIQDRHGYNALAVAAKNGHLEVLKVLLEYCSNPGIINDETKTQNSAMDLAAMMGHSECVKALIDAGAKINIDTVLIHTAQGGHYDTMALLIDSYKQAHSTSNFLCCLEFVNKAGMAPIHVAALYGHDQCVKLLIDEGANPCQGMVITNESALMLAAGKGNHKVVDEVIAAIVQYASKCGLNQYSIKRKTALHYAATAGSEKCVRALLAAGVKTDLKDSHGYTPLLLAVERGHSDVVRMLIHAKCDVNAERKQGWNGLHLAALNDNTQCCESLIEAGLSPDASSWISQVSPLVLAAKKGHINILKLLIDNGADIELADCEGMTPLYHAARYNKAACVRHLIERGANLDRRGQDLSAAQLAANHGSFGTLKLLIFYNCDLTGICPITDPCFPSPSFKDMVHLLVEAGCHILTDVVSQLPMAVINPRYQVFMDSEDQDDCEISWHKVPRRLQMTCRAVIRRSMGRGLEFRNDLYMLPVPNEIRSFIGIDQLLIDVDKYWSE